MPLLLTIFQYWDSPCDQEPVVAGPVLGGFCLTSLSLYLNNIRIAIAISWSISYFQNTIFGSIIPIDIGY